MQPPFLRQGDPGNDDIPKESLGLFDKIISAIESERERKNTKRLLVIFLALFAYSLMALPFSLSLFVHQWDASKASYFISAAVENASLFFSVWQDFTLSVLESLPVMSMALLLFNISLFLFTARLFLYKKGLLFKYVKRIIA